MEDKFTLEDKVLQDSLAAVGSYSQKPQNQYKLLVLGGIANQLYAYPAFANLMRPTTDLDLVANSPITYAAFRHELGRSLAQKLEKYNPEIKPRSHHTFQLSLKDQDGDPLLIHIYRRSINRYNLEKNSIERQFSNANRLQIPNTSSAVYILRTEDLLEQKIGVFSRLKRLERLHKIPKEFKELYEKIKKRDWIALANQDINSWLSELKKEKTRLPSHYDHGHEAFQEALDHYCSFKDIFDICLLLKLAVNNSIDFDEDYLTKITEEEKRIVQG